MSDQPPVTQRLLRAVRPPDKVDVARAWIPVLLALGALYGLFRIFQGDWIALVVFLPGWLLLLGLAAYEPLQTRLLRRPFDARHVLHITFLWLYSVGWLFVLRVMLAASPTGKESQVFYVALLVLLMFTWAALRALSVVLTPFGYEVFTTTVPLWEQVLLAANELLAGGLLAYLLADLLVQVFQPFVFSVQVNPTYDTAVVIFALMYYGGMQLLWVQRGNDWLSRGRVWLVVMRGLLPFVLLVLTMAIAQRFTDRIDPRTANLLGNSDVNLAFLSFAPVVWLLVLVLSVLLLTSRRGLRQRLLPSALLAHLPERVRRALETISDVDVVLLLGVLLTLVPANLLLLSDSGGVVDALREVVLQRGSAFIETSEQALALVFSLPFYTLILAVMILYALVIGRPDLSAGDRDDLLQVLPIGFLIAMIIILYLFAVPFTQVFTEGRLPQLSRDLGRILVFYVFVPLILLYVHFFLLVRWPYGRGQSRWRERHGAALDHDLRGIDRRINNLNQEIRKLEANWQIVAKRTVDAVQNERLDMLYRYVRLNGERDDLNMQRLQIVAKRQQLAEISETPYSVAVAQLPTRIISIGLPLLLAIQVYQWAILNEGLREVVNNPNITVLDFIAILLENIEF